MFDELYAALSRFRRVRLAHLPTPLEHCPRLSQALGGSQIFVKRDDLTGLALGGNKTRSLEFRLGEAVARGADTVLLAVEATSNSARQTVAAANRLGLRCVLFLRGAPDEPVEGNLLVDKILGAEIHLAEADRFDDLIPAMDEYAATLKKQGHRPFVMNTSPMFSLGSALGYALCFAELAQQCAAAGIMPSRIYITSSGRSLAGLALGMSFSAMKAGLFGISAVPGLGASAGAALAWAREAQDALGCRDRQLDDHLVHCTDEFAGIGYGVPTPGSTEALLLAARYEGLLLDPVYTAKGMSGLLEHVRRGEVRRSDALVFVHTGGLPALFRRPDALLAQAERAQAPLAAAQASVLARSEPGRSGAHRPACETGPIPRSGGPRACAAASQGAGMPL